MTSKIVLDFMSLQIWDFQMFIHYNQDMLDIILNFEKLYLSIG